MGGRTLAILALVAALATGPAAAEPPRGPFADWAAIVVAGDWRAHDGGPTEAFDNARRDVAATLVALGFRRENLVQLSTRPERYPDTRPERLTSASMAAALSASAARARSGCLVYYTSHGGPPGVVLDVEGEMSLLSPAEMAAMVDQACPGRPTIVVVSACFSGVFLPHLQGPQRMVMTAARPDRSSFGCSAEDKYPYFDACFMESVGTVRNFAALATAVQGCVGRREAEKRLSPPSEPQVSIDPGLRFRLGMMPFPADARAVQQP
ncbi:MAG: C13 family peptidase [Pseudomonadota bacterium]